MEDFLSPVFGIPLRVRLLCYLGIERTRIRIVEDRVILILRIFANETANEMQGRRKSGGEGVIV